MLAGLVAVAAAGVYGVSHLGPPATPPQPAATPATLAAPAPASGPSFDIVRVAPSGGVVMAGHAEPGAKVAVHDGDRLVGEADADGRGAWVMIPDAKLPAGGRELTLSSRDGAGRVATAEAPVVVVVPPRPDAPPSDDFAPVPPPPALAVLAPPSGPSRVLQLPGGHSAGRALAMDTVDYDEHGAIRFSGSAPPDTPVRVYVDNAPVGEARAGADGHWAVSPPTVVAPGVHALRVDQVTPQGRVASRVEMPFQRETLALSQVAPGQVVVQPGQSLWRLARRVYGNGLRYTVIYLANKDQIRNASLIYPGQVFTVPSAEVVAH